MAEKIHDLKNTYGSFKFVGKVSGVEGNNFYKEHIYYKDEKKTIVKGKKREVNFSVETSPSNKLFVKLDGFLPKDGKATFQKWDSETKKRIENKVDWEDRFEYKEEGFYPSFGVKLGFRSEDQFESNSYFGWDACEELSLNLQDGMSIVVEGNVKVSSYTKDDGTKKQKTEYSITKVFELKGEVDFEAEDFDEDNKFTQRVVYTGIEKHPENQDRFVLSAVIVNSDGVENIEYIVDNKTLASKLKKNLKEYNAIDLLVRIVNKVEEAEVEEDAWGDDTDMEAPRHSYVRELICTKAYPNSIDKESYTQEKIDSIRNANSDFGGSLNDDDGDVW